MMPMRHHFCFPYSEEMIRTCDEKGLGEDILPHQSCIANIRFDISIGMQRITAPGVTGSIGTAIRGQSPLWSTLCVPEFVRIMSGVPKETLQLEWLQVF